ncbi:MAG: sugar transferase [Crocinitomicaceae bacterium]|nr:sugar transferase [Crocinitomicaceae bacterium]
MKRGFDILFSLFFIILFFPFMFLIAVFIIADSRGGALFRQTRVGKNSRQFRLLKFRTMKVDAEKSGQITIGARDERITRVGYYLRKYKIDELPQLLNIFIGDMSVVGPRPEVPRYVALYNDEQKKVLTVRPGLTDFASLKYFSESELLARSENPEKTYITEVMPTKLRLNKEYIENVKFSTDLRIIWQTIVRIFS